MQPAQLTLQDQAQWSKLLGLAFDRPREDMIRVLDALHDTYPVVAWGVWDGATLAAQYSCLLRELLVPGFERPLTVGFSVNMAVHPDYRGQGLIKLASEPVYQAVRAAGAVAGVGFSNAQGVKVDRRSRSYGYQVVGKLRSTLGVLVRRPNAEPLALMDDWPVWGTRPDSSNAAPAGHLPFGAAAAPAGLGALVRFANSPRELDHRYGRLARRYRFAVWSDPDAQTTAQGDSPIRGVVVYRLVRARGIRVASLIGAHGEPLPTLVTRWARAMWDNGWRAIHTLSSPASPALAALRDVALTTPLPVSRAPYFLTVKPLGPETPDVLFDFDRWDCLGGDIL